MATRNPANVIRFNVGNFGAPVSVYLIGNAAGADAQVAPGEDMEAFVEAVQKRGITLAIGAYNAGSFRIYVENSGWDAATLETAVQAVGGVFAAATVADATL
jgi:hypothetical protein